MIILETDRLTLRHPVPDDLDALYVLYRRLLYTSRCV